MSRKIFVFQLGWFDIEEAARKCQNRHLNHTVFPSFLFTASYSVSPQQGLATWTKASHLVCLGKKARARYHSICSMPSIGLDHHYNENSVEESLIRTEVKYL